MTIKITNPDLFHSRLISVDVSNTRHVTDQSFYGDVEFVDHDGCFTVSGEHGYNDYVNQYGLKIVKNN